MAVEGACVGGRISGVRYAAGRVDVKIQDLLLLLEGFSVFWAARGFVLASASHSVLVER